MGKGRSSSRLKDKKRSIQKKLIKDGIIDRVVSNTILTAGTVLKNEYGWDDPQIVDFMKHVLSKLATAGTKGEATRDDKEPAQGTIPYTRGAISQNEYMPEIAAGENCSDGSPGNGPFAGEGESPVDIGPTGGVAPDIEGGAGGCLEAALGTERAN
ncbi:MAG: hypothetical protein ACYCX4_03855 [Bacillota bacterium]